MSLNFCFTPLFSVPPSTPLRCNRPSRSFNGVSQICALKDASITEFISKSRVEGFVLEKAKATLESDEVELSPLYDDGFGTTTVVDYFLAAREICKPDGGPPRWFCPIECGKPIKDSPLLLFLPGADGTGLGLIKHHKSLGRVFEVRCLHIPVKDRTPFEGLVNIVENSVKYEHSLLPNQPIYLVGDSLGGCLALAIAARNPTVDFVLILVNPATSFGRSQLQPLLPVLRALPNNLHTTVPYFLSFIMGDPVKIAMTRVADDVPLPESLSLLSASLSSLLPYLSELADILPKETLSWKLYLLESGSAFVNSRLHAVDAEVLVLASGKDNLLPSGEEADRLWSSLKNCRVRYFPENGHTLLLEDGVNLLNVIKGTCLYRRSHEIDFVSDYLPPSLAEYRKTFEKDNRLFLLATSPVMFSTMKDGRVVKGLDGVPDEGPVLFVGYHMLVGLELVPLYSELLKTKKVTVRGMAHPMLFARNLENSRREMLVFDDLKVFGASPVSAMNMYKLFSKKSFVLLYPGGAREALHRKGEEYKLFWPSQPEFVRMAARFGATIVPFGVVGEDDAVELVLDYDDLMNNPITRQLVKNFNVGSKKARTGVNGNADDQELVFPGLLPKLPGRFYYLFGKPIETKGKEEILQNRDNAKKLYLEIKSEIEGVISHLKKRREEDPYRSVVARAIYEASWGFTKKAPAIDP